MLQFVYERAFSKVFGARPGHVATPAKPLAGPDHGHNMALNEDVTEESRCGLRASVSRKSVAELSSVAAQRIWIKTYN